MMMSISFLYLWTTFYISLLYIILRIKRSKAYCKFVTRLCFKNAVSFRRIKGCNYEKQVFVCLTDAVIQNV